MDRFGTSRYDISEYMFPIFVLSLTSQVVATCSPVAVSILAVQGIKILSFSKGLLELIQLLEAPLSAKIKTGSDSISDINVGRFLFTRLNAFGIAYICVLFTLVVAGRGSFWFV